MLEGVRQGYAAALVGLRLCLRRPCRSGTRLEGDDRSSGAQLRTPEQEWEAAREAARVANPDLAQCSRAQVQAGRPLGPEPNWGEPPWGCF